MYGALIFLRRDEQDMQSTTSIAMNDAAMKMENQSAFNAMGNTNEKHVNVVLSE